MDDCAIKLIHNYISTNLSLSRIFLNEEWFQERSYARWAAYEILERVMEESFDLSALIMGRYERNIVEIIDEFILQIERLLSIRYIQEFQVALDTAKSIKVYLMRSDLV